MIKKLMPLFVVLSIVLIIITIFLFLADDNHKIVIQENNLKQIPLKMRINKYQDSDCGMVIDSLDYASQVVAKNGKTWFFHDHGGFIRWLEDKKFKDDVVIWVMSRDTKQWIDAKKAYYSLTDKTPMGYGFGAYKNKRDGFIDFETMKLKMLRGETLNNPRIRQKLKWKQ